MFTIPSICGTIRCALSRDVSTLEWTGLHWWHWRSLTSRDRHACGIWLLVMGQIRQWSTGLVAIHTRIGWIISGPTCGSTKTDEKSDGLITYTQRMLSVKLTLGRFKRTEIPQNLHERLVCLSNTFSLKTGDIKLHCPGNSQGQIYRTIQCEETSWAAQAWHWRVWQDHQGSNTARDHA